MKNQLLFIRALFSTNFRAAYALRAAFWLQAALMLANNLIFFTTWLVFFRRFDNLGGWRLPEVTALYGMVGGAFGVHVLLGAGLRNLAELIARGDLDSYLTKPKNVLVHVACSKSQPSGWGEMVSAALLLSLSGLVTWQTAPLAVLLMLSGGLIFLSTTVLIHSAAFWLGPVNSLARTVCDFVVLFSVYPQSVYSGALKILVFTLIPAGFIGFLPVEALRDFSWLTLAETLGGSVAYALLALLVFHLGLRRYESGNAFGVIA